MDTDLIVDPDETNKIDFFYQCKIVSILQKRRLKCSNNVFMFLLNEMTYPNYSFMCQLSKI